MTRADREKLRRRLRRLRGLCTLCGKARSETRAMCEPCAESRRESNRAWVDRVGRGRVGDRVLTFDDFLREVER